MKLYMIRDTNTGAFYETPKGKVAWKTSGHAKCAYMTHLGYRQRKNIASFAQQCAYECVEVTLMIERVV